MALRVIGAGLGRTGTLTLKAGLEQLGFGPCHHMVEVFAHPEQRAFWRRAAEGEAVDWEEVFADYRASVDWPSCHFWRQLSERYPDARLVLTVRDAQGWWESMSGTILKVIAAGMADTDPERRAASRFAELIIAQQTFGGDFSQANVIAAFERHNAAVQAAIPAERLLVYEVAQGWGPLCDFLGVPVPAAEFPRTNSRETFWTHTLPPDPRRPHMAGGGDPA
jgi:hypothetical protein